MNALALDGVVEDTFDCVIAKVCERGGGLHSPKAPPFLLEAFKAWKTHAIELCWLPPTHTATVLSLCLTRDAPAPPSPAFTSRRAPSTR